MGNPEKRLKSVHIAGTNGKGSTAAMTASPTGFELVTCIGLEFFTRQNCDIVVLEVGMGGALDEMV